MGQMKMMKTKIPHLLARRLSVCFAFLGCVFVGQGQQPLSLLEATQLALSHNYGIELGRLRADAAALNNAWGAAGALPQIGLTATTASAVSDQSENPTSFIQERLESESVNIGGQLNWTLFDGLGMFANKRRLELLTEQSAGELDLLIEQSLLAVITAYQSVVVQDVALEALEASMAMSRDRLDWLSTRRSVGAAGEFDNLQFENALLLDSAAWVRQKVARRTAQRNLNRLMGTDETQQWSLTSSLVVLQTANERFPEEEGLINKALNTTTTVRNAMLTVQLAETGMDQAESRLYPTLGLNVNLGDVRSQFAAGDLSGEGRTKNQSATLALNFNLFNGGATKRAIEQARIQLDIAETNRMNERAAVAQLLRDALDRYRTQEELYGIARETTANAEALLAIAETRYDLGALSSFDLREVQLSVLQAKLREVQELQAWHQSQWDVERLTGGLLSGYGVVARPAE